MSGPIAIELATAAATLQQRVSGIYAIPWYLVVGEPASGRSTAIRSMNLTWTGDGPTKLPIEQHCTWWMPAECVIIEPGRGIFGPQRNPELLKSLGEDLRALRPREPIDGVLLTLSVADFADLEEQALEAYANNLRAYLVELGRHIHAEIPVYVIVNRYDAMWGFAEVFQWTPERKGEDPWGFRLPPDTPTQQAIPQIKTELEALAARFEAFCFAKLSGEDPPEHRTRAFQHLCEVRSVIDKLAVVLGIVGMASSFERAPWIRGLTIGSAIPGTGDRIRAGTKRFFAMGLAQPSPAGGTNRPGGLPIFSFLKDVVLPEKDLVPTRARWRDDTLVLASAIMAGVVWLAAIATIVVFAIIH